jgi:hypothetical protein
MGVRRERPPIERAGSSIRLRLPDGTVREMPVESSGPSTKLCCFCGEAAERDVVTLSVEWRDEQGEQRRTWASHRRCLAERLHESVQDAGGPFADA